MVKTHSDQISRLTYAVESLQSQIKQIDQRGRSGNNNASSRRRNRSITKTKKSKTASKKSKGKSPMKEVTTLISIDTMKLEVLSRKKFKCNVCGDNK